LASLNTARAKARDAQRIGSLKQLQLALELYKDKYGSYPVANADGSNRKSSCGNAGGNGSMIVGKWSPELDVLVTEGFLPSLPVDPKQNTYPADVSSALPHFCYTYLSSSVSSSNFADCVPSQTTIPYASPPPSGLEDIDNYEYVIYYTLENPPTTGLKLYWGNNASPSANRCLLGPHK
jgi:hypothetical protein